MTDRIWTFPPSVDDNNRENPAFTRDVAQTDVMSLILNELREIKLMLADALDCGGIEEKQP